MNFFLLNSVKTNENINYSVRPYTESNKEKLIEKLKNIEENWLDIFPTNNVDNMLQNLGKFLTIFTDNVFLKKLNS